MSRSAVRARGGDQVGPVDSRAPASASAATARPFHAATTLSSRAGWGRSVPGLREPPARRRPARGVVGVARQLQRRGPVLEGPLGGHRQQTRRPSPSSGPSTSTSCAGVQT